jgi:hypothetical protein
MPGGGHRLEPRSGQAGPHPGADRAEFFVATADHDRHGERELAEPAAEPGLPPGAERAQTRGESPRRAGESLAAKVGASRAGQPRERGEERHPLPGTDECREAFTLELASECLVGAPPAGALCRAGEARRGALEKQALHALRMCERDGESEPSTHRVTYEREPLDRDRLERPNDEFRGPPKRVGVRVARGRRTAVSGKVECHHMVSPAQRAAKRPPAVLAAGESVEKDDGGRVPRSFVGQLDGAAADPEPPNHAASSRCRRRRSSAAAIVRSRSVRFRPRSLASSTTRSPPWPSAASSAAVNPAQDATRT